MGGHARRGAELTPPTGVDLYVSDLFSALAATLSPRMTRGLGKLNVPLFLCSDRAHVLIGCLFVLPFTSPRLRPDKRD